MCYFQEVGSSFDFNRYLSPYHSNDKLALHKCGKFIICVTQVCLICDAVAACDWKKEKQQVQKKFFEHFQMSDKNRIFARNKF